MERGLKLINKDEDILDFMELDNFGHSPEGLGLEMDNVTYQAYSSFKNVQLNIKRNEIKLKITTGAISDKPYETFHKLLRFINVGGLKLVYDVPDVGTFYRDVSFQKISKTDAAEYHVLQEELELNADNPWYNWEEISKEQPTVTGAGKIYDDEFGIPNTVYSLGPNFETFDITQTGLPQGMTTGGGSTFTGFGTDAALLPNGLTNYMGVKAVASPTAQAGLRMDSTNWFPNMKIKIGDLFQVEYWVKNTSTTVTSQAMRAYCAMRTTGGGQVNIPALSGNADTKFTIANDGKWHQVIGDVHKAQVDGYGPVGFAYSYDVASTLAGTQFQVAGMRLKKISPDNEDVIGGDFNFNGIDSETVISDDKGSPLTNTLENGIIGSTALLTGMILGAGTDSTKFSFVQADGLDSYDITKAASIKAVASPTGQAGIRMHSSGGPEPGITVAPGDQFRTSYWVRNTFTQDLKFNAHIAYNRTDTGAQTNMVMANGGSLPSFTIPADGTWYKVLGGILTPAYAGSNVMGYAYTFSLADTIANASFEVAGFEVHRITRQAKESKWQTWATGDDFEVNKDHRDDEENILQIDAKSSTAVVRTNETDSLPKDTLVRAKFKAKLTFDEGVTPTTAVSNIFGLSLYPTANPIPDWTISDSANPAYDTVAISNSGSLIAGTKMKAKLVSDPVDPTDGDWHNYEIEFNALGTNQYAHSFFYKTAPGFQIEIQSFSIVTPSSALQTEADGPYSVISPRTTIYQTDYTTSTPILEIDNDSMYFGVQKDSSLRVTITPKKQTISNPHWQLRDEEMTILQTEGFLNVDIAVGQKLVVSSDPFERYMRLVDVETGDFDEIDYAIDPTCTGWIRIPVGKSKLELSPELAAVTKGFNGPNIKVEYKKEWLVV